MLNATWLETFATLCETGHFTRAAARLNMTQPGVSQHLRKLEAQLGQPLITRLGKSFAPTPQGEAVLALALKRREEDKRLLAEIAADDRDSGELRIGCSGSFAMLLYPLLLPWMHAAPGLKLRLEAAPQAALRAGLLEARFDLCVLDADPDHPRLEARHLGREELCLLLPAGAGPVQGFANLEARGFIDHPDGASYADELLKLNFPEAYPGADRLRIRGFVNQIGQIPAAVAAGVGYTLLPRSGVAAFAGRDRLSLAALPRRRWHALWLAARRGGALPARLHHAGHLIGEAAAQLEAFGAVPPYTKG